MATGKVATYRMETRMAIADAMVNGRDYDEIRAYLETTGLEGEALPSDHSLKTFQESVEYQSVYADRRTACELQMKAGRVTGCASARVALLQNRVLEVFELWMDKGLLEPADMFKVLSFTLQFQRQELAGRKLRLQMGDPAVPEALGPQAFSVAQMEAIMARLAAEREQWQAEDEAAERAVAEQAADEVATGVEGTEQVAGAVVSERDDEDVRGSRRIMEDFAGSGRMSEDAGGFLRMTEERDVAVGDDVALNVDAFGNSPSAAVRQKARAKRRKRQKRGSRR